MINGNSAPSASLGTESVHLMLRNSTLNLVAQAINAVFNLCVVFVLARYLGKDGLGEFYTLVALTTVFQWVLDPGITTVLTCRIAQVPTGWKDSVAEAGGILIAIVFASTAVFLCIGGLWAWIDQSESILFRFAAAGLACAALQVQRFCSGVFRAFDLFGVENGSKVLQGAMFAGLVLALAWSGWITLVSALGMFALSHVAAAVFLLGMLQWRWGCVSWKFSPRAIQSWFGQAIPLGLGDVVRVLTWQIDTLLLRLLQPAVVVGIYSVAYRPLGPLNWLPRAVLQATFPSFARMAVGDASQLDRAFANSIRLLWVISLPIAIGICICAEPIVVLLAGSEYLEAAAPMRILIWITSLSFLSTQFRYLFTAVGKPQLFARLVILIFFLEASLELLLIPHWSYYGACTGSVVGELVFTLLGLLLCRRLGLGSIDWSAMSRAALAGLIMAILLWMVRENNIVILIAAAVPALLIYFAICVLIGALKWQEIQRMYEAIIGFVPSRTKYVYADQIRPKP